MITLFYNIDVERKSIFGKVTDEEETSNRMIQVLLLLLLLFAEQQATLVLHSRDCSAYFFLFVAGFKYFTLVAPLSRAAKSPCVKGTLYFYSSLVLGPKCSTVVQVS